MRYAGTVGKRSIEHRLYATEWRCARDRGAIRMGRWQVIGSVSLRGNRWMRTGSLLSFV